MNVKEYDEILKVLSRRNFLRTGSAVLATALMAQGATLRAQERPNTQAAEHDHSSSDPGQENKPLLDENPDSNLPPPTDHGDMVPLWYSFDLVKKRVEEGGWTHEVTERELPSSKDSQALTCASPPAAIASYTGTLPTSGHLCCTEKLESP
jgi:oxalate decarboxylase